MKRNYLRLAAPLERLAANKSKPIPTRLLDRSNLILCCLLNVSYFFDIFKYCMPDPDYLIRLASQIDATLDSGLTGIDVSYGDNSYEAVLSRNKVTLAPSAYELDTLDWVFCCLTGVGGGVLDLTRTIDANLTNEELHQKFDKLSSDYLKKVIGIDGKAAIDNIRGGPLHRIVGPTHDLSRFFEAVKDIMKGEFHANVRGTNFIETFHSSASKSPYVQIDGPVDAAIVLLLHMIGDFFSKTSLPIPGRSKLAESEYKEIVKEVFAEYRNGGNLRKLVSEFLSNVTGTILIALVLRLYRYMRIAIERRSMPGLSLKDDDKFHVLDRNAQTISFVISVGKAAFTSNPLALNYTGFVQIIRSGAAINRISTGEQAFLNDKLVALDARIRSL